MTIFDFDSLSTSLESAIQVLRQPVAEKGIDRTRDCRAWKPSERLLRQIFSHLRPWDKVLPARHPKRPYALDHIRLMCESFVELVRRPLRFDDPAIVAVWALGVYRLVIVGSRRGATSKSARSALRHGETRRLCAKHGGMFRLAEKFRSPVLTLVDTPAADPGVESESRGISEAIARRCSLCLS